MNGGVDNKARSIVHSVLVHADRVAARLRRLIHPQILTANVHQQFSCIDDSISINIEFRTAYQQQQTYAVERAKVAEVLQLPGACVETTQEEQGLQETLHKLIIDMRTINKHLALLENRCLGAPWMPWLRKATHAVGTLYQEIFLALRRSLPAFVSMELDGSFEDLLAEHEDDVQALRRSVQLKLRQELDDPQLIVTDVSKGSFIVSCMHNTLQYGQQMAYKLYQKENVLGLPLKQFKVTAPLAAPTTVLPLDKKTPVPNLEALAFSARFKQPSAADFVRSAFTVAGFDLVVVNDWICEVDQPLFIDDEPGADAGNLRTEASEYWIRAYLESVYDPSLLSERTSFKKIGLSSDAISEIEGNVPSEIMQKQTPFYWVEALLEDRLNWATPQFFDFISRITGVRAETYGKRSFMCIRCPLEDVSIKRQPEEMSSLIEQLNKKYPDSKLWHHATSWHHAENIINTGIRLSEGAKQQDFTHGNGFYLNPDDDDARKWCGQRYSRWKDCCVLTFAVEPALLSDKARHLDLSNDLDQWEEIVRLSRSGQHLDFDRYHNVQSLFGPQCTNLNNLIRRDSNNPIPSSCSNQLALRHTDIANEFTTRLVGVTFFLPKSPWPSTTPL
eukprot:TRINITY_DN6299_c0_g1_i1.p1 TRINITY_DN6299_c0_g1~~TRINITY_DN6299_c0_g1_i1.p1  ORF type:complete len:617 (-),score=59.94 TRINITY_DN6299_c0_g1_i1:269-2119(-)